MSNNLDNEDNGYPTRQDAWEHVIREELKISNYLAEVERVRRNLMRLLIFLIGAGIGALILSFIFCG